MSIKNDYEQILKTLSGFIEDVSKKYSVPDVMLRRSLNKTWFNDTLAWLLDPKTGDKLGVSFINEFVKLIAKKRSDTKNGYKQKASHLRYQKHGTGRLVTGTNQFSLKNASVMREYYLSKKKIKKGYTALFCDVVVIDLDKSDGIILVIENKLFSTNHPQQLEEYFNIIEEKYETVPVKEYVYLTLLGENPVEFTECNKNILRKEWVRVSWISDILPILEKLKLDDEYESTDVRRIRELLYLMKELMNPQKTIRNAVEKFVEIIINQTANCLLEELNRLSSMGNWTQKDSIKSTLCHSSVPTRLLRIQMLPNLCITVHGQRKSKQSYEKILIPFGAHPDQVSHLIFRAAKGIYTNHFNDSSKYMNKKHEDTLEQSTHKQTIKPLLDFIFKYRDELQILLNLSNHLKKANRDEMEDNEEEF